MGFQSTKVVNWLHITRYFVILWRKNMTIKRRKIIRATTVPVSLEVFCRDMLRELSQRYDVIALSSPGDELNRVAEREGVRTVSVDMKRRISPFSDLISLLRLIVVFLRERPWMVHSMTPKAGLLCMIAAWIARVPRRVHTFTGLMWPTATGIKRRVLVLADKILCACATHIVPEGAGVKRDLEQNGITDKPMRVLANGNVRGVDLTWYCRSADVMMEAERLRRDDLFTFVYVGRIVKDKGIEELVNAFLRLNGERRATRLLLVGNAEKEIDPVSDDVNRLIGNTSSIELLGYRKDVRPYMAASDVLVFPSYREGFPNVVIEAGAMGLPSIVTDINGSNEIISQAENGLIVPVKDTDALYAAMLQMTDNDTLFRYMSLNARRMVESRYDCHVVRKALYDFYASL